ncbi:MAG: YdcF family protein [Desulfuromonadales bacterium]|nr:YdcF family protein [Desulfuromonadales bacterium]
MDYLLFLLKKILGDFLTPVPLTLLLLLLAVPSLLRRKNRWFGVLCVVVATTLLFVSSYAPLNSRWIADLETRYPAYEAGESSADFIAVLGSWHQTVDDQPLTSELSATAIVRLAEGIRIYRLHPGSRLIFTGYHGLWADPVAYPEKLRALAVALGVPDGDILTFVGPRDTAEEAQLMADLFADTEMVLVTSATHMPRSMELFRGAGLDPTPAPTGHLSKPTRHLWRLPDGEALARTDALIHEHMGILWARLMGQGAQ